MASNPQILGTAPIGKLLMQYSLPSIVAMALTSVYNIIDSVFIGYGVGAMALSGLAITLPLMALLSAFSSLVGVGGATIASICMGQKNLKGAEDILGNVVLLSLIIAVTYGGINYLFLDGILCFFGASDATIGYARDFMEIILLGSPVLFLFLGLNNVMRATGYPKKAMLSSTLSVGCNIALAPLFIFVFGWGIRGAAIATVLSQIAAMVWVAWHFLDKRTFVRIKLQSLRIDRRIVRQIFSIGVSPFALSACACFIVIYTNYQLLAYGNDFSVGAYGIINRMQMLFVMIIMGVAQGMQPIVGYNYGAGQTARMRQCVTQSIVVATVVSVAGFALSVFTPQLLVECFTDNAILVRMASRAFKLCMIAYPIVGAQIIISQYFQSIGKTSISIFLSLSRQLLFLLPCLVLLPMWRGIDGVWLSISLSDFIASVVAIAIYFYYRDRIVTRV